MNKNDLIKLKEFILKNRQLNLFFDNKDIEIFHKYMKTLIDTKSNILFDPFVLELSCHKNIYNRFIQPYLNLSYEELQSYILNKNNTILLEQYFHDHADLINPDNQLYKNALDEYIKKIMANKSLYDSKWYVHYLLNKTGKLNNINIKVATVTKLTFLTHHFNWNNPIKLSKHKEIWQARGLNFKNANSEGIIINIANHYVHNDIDGFQSYLYNLMHTCFHEMAHTLQRDKQDFKAVDYKILKENYIIAYDPKIYHQYHCFFNAELDANLVGFDMLEKEVNTTDYLPFDGFSFRQQIINDRALHTSFGMSVNHDKVTDYFDQIIINHPVLSLTGYLGLEYNGQGKRRTLNDYFAELANRDVSVTDYLYKTSPDFFNTVNHITYNIIKQYTPEELVAELDLAVTIKDYKLLNNAIKQEIDEVSANIILIKKGKIIPSYYDILNEYNTNKLNKAETYLKTIKPNYQLRLIL